MKKDEEIEKEKKEMAAQVVTKKSRHFSSKNSSSYVIFRLKNT